VMPRSPVPEPAVAVGEDPRRYARLMSEVYDATMAGDRAPARPRKVIEDSWHRLMARGIDPDALPAPEVEDATLDMLRLSSGLMAVLDEISRGLESLVAEGDNILVVADAQGRVLWRSGSRSVLGKADRLGFVEGAHWGENAVGTNAIGTALMSNGAVQVFSAEHYARSHHSWTCAGAPIRTRGRVTSSAWWTCQARRRRCIPLPSRWSTRWLGSPKHICVRSTTAP